jgi:hypothetical protein
MAIVVRLQHHHIHLILNLQNENKNKMLNRLSFLSENDDPQKYKGYMIEKVNISQVMNQYQIVTDADHVYVEKGNSQGKIKKNDFFNLLPFKNYGVVEGSLDEIGSGFGYNSNGDGSGISGMFLCVNYSQCRFQLKSDLLGNTLKVRSSNFYGEWTNWKSISFT